MEFNNTKTLKYGLFTSFLVALGPVIWLFINISEEKYESLPLNIAFAIITLGIFLFNLKIYLKDSKRTTVTILKLIVDFLFYIALIASLVIAFIAFYILIAFIQGIIFIRAEYILYMIKSPYSYIMFLIVILAGGRIGMVFYKEKETVKAILPLKIFIPIILVLTYILITSTTVISKDGIYDYSFYNLKGERYEFNEVKAVSTGFKDKGRNKGEFFYNIELNNGKKFKLASPSLTQTTEKYEEDTWQEYVDLDEIIMEAGAKKNSSEEGYEHLSMDKIYIDKLLKVVRNK